MIKRIIAKIKWWRNLPKLCAFWERSYREAIDALGREQMYAGELQHRARLQAQEIDRLKVEVAALEQSKQCRFCGGKTVCDNCYRLLPAKSRCCDCGGPLIEARMVTRYHSETKLPYKAQQCGSCRSTEAAHQNTFKKGLEG